MKWSNAIKSRTIENTVAQMIVGGVLMIGYIAYEEIQRRREEKRLDQFRQFKSHS